MPLRQRGGQPILLWRRHLHWLRQRPSGLHQHPPFFALFPPAKMDSIASPPTPASTDEPNPAIAGSLAPLVYAEDFIEGGRWWGGGVLVGR